MPPQAAVVEEVFTKKCRLVHDILANTVYTEASALYANAFKALLKLSAADLDGIKVIIGCK